MVEDGARRVRTSAAHGQVTIGNKHWGVKSISGPTHSSLLSQDDEHAGLHNHFAIYTCTV